LLYGWHLDVNPWLNLTVAIIAGLAIELLAISSVFLSSSLYRWNQYGHVRKEHGWEKAPFSLALSVTVVYFAIAVYLLVVLEAIPDLARFSAIAFPILAGVGAVNWSLFQQHQDRLDRYGLQWSFKAQREQQSQPDQKHEPARPAKYQPDKVDVAIMSALRKAPDAPYSLLSRMTGLPKSTVGARMLRLKKAKLVVQQGDNNLVTFSGNGDGDTEYAR